MPLYRPLTGPEIDRVADSVDAARRLLKTDSAASLFDLQDLYAIVHRQNFGRRSFDVNISLPGLEFVSY
jgi:hypothetical protein